MELGLATTKIATRIIALPVEDNGQIMNFGGIHGSFATFYEKLVRGEPVQCAKSGLTYESVGSPTSAILDVSRTCYGLFTHTDLVFSSSPRNL